MELHLQQPLSIQPSIPLTELVSESQLGSSSGFLKSKRRGSVFRSVKHTESEVPLETTVSVDDPFDDGGLDYPENDPKFQRQAWLVVFGSFMGLLPTWGISNAEGVIQTHLLKNELKALPTTTVSWVFSMYTCLGLVSSVFSGTYFDRNGAREPIIVGALLFAGGFFAMANATKLWQFILSFGLCAGLGSGILMSPLMGAIAHWFPKKKRATAMAIAGNGGCVGGFLFPIMLRKTYATWGYQWSMRAVGFISIFCHIISLLLVKERTLVEKKPMNRRETLHYYLTGSFDVKAVYTDRRYLFNILGCVFAECSTIITGAYFSFICTQSGFTEAEAFLFVTIEFAISIPSRWLSGVMADKWFGSYNVIIAQLVLSGIADLVIWMPFQTKTAALYVYSIVYGIFFGGILSLVPNCCSQINRAEKFGARYATQYFITGMVVLGMMPAGSAIVGSGESRSQNSGFIVFVAVLGFLSACSYGVTKVMSVGWKHHKF